MKTTLRGGFVAVGLLVGMIWGAQLASAQTFGIPVAGFTTSNVCKNSATPPPACQVLTDGSPRLPAVVTGGVLRLTTANMNQHGAAWFYVPQPISTGFTTAFQFQISSTNSCFFCTFPADGMALVIQNDPAGTGALGYTGNGQNLAYGNEDISTASGPGKAIKNSLAIELDTHQNSDYGDPDGNHIAVQSCGPNNSSTLTPNSADHNYACPDGNLAKIALQSLPTGMSLTDGKTHTITVNYLPPGTCTSGCNNLSVYMDSTLIVQATVNIATQLNLTNSGGAYLGFTAATGSQVQNNDIISWTFSSLPLAPITINQPLQPTQTNFNYTPVLTAVADYSQSGLGGNSFTGVVMQGTAQPITDQQFSDLVNNTPFQGSTCQHQDTGTGNYNCVTTTDLCTTPTNGNASGANCPNTGTNALILVSNSYNLDPAQKPLIAPGYIMGKDTALSCGASGDNTCKGLVSIFTGINGDLISSGGKTNNFNSILIPILGVVQPSTAATTTPALNSGWTNGSVTLNFNSVDVVPSNNTNPPSTLPLVSSITYSATGANLPSPASGTVAGPSGSIVIPGTVEGTTIVTFFGTDTAGTIESVTTNSGNQVSTASPTITIQVDKTAPVASCVGPNPTGWQAADVVYNCTASDSGSGLANSSQSNFALSTNVPAGTETASAAIPLVTIFDVAGNSTSQGPFGPFEVDKKAPVISGPTISPSSPTYGQTVTANYSCTDGGSGVVLCGPSGSATIPATGSTGPLSSPADGSVGTHTVTINAQDAVGNATTPSSVTYTVAQGTPTVTFTGAPATAAYLSTFTVSATTNASTTAVITAAGSCSIAGNVATMTSGAGICSLTATWAADANYVAATASQSTSATKIAPTVTFTGAPVSAPYLSTFTVASTTNASTTAVITAAGACSITGNSVKMTSGTGACSLSANWAADNNYLAATASQSTNASQLAPTVSFTGAPGSAVFGSNFSVSATTNASTAAVITAAGACSVAGSLVTMTSGTGVCALTATWAPDSNYLGATATQATNATRAASILTWPTPAPIPYGTPLGSIQLNATANVPGVFVYTPPAGTVLPAGTQTLSVAFTPTASMNYTSATAQVTIQVTQAAISISPSSVNFGTVTNGKTATQSVTVSNVGNATLNISNVSIKCGSSCDSDDFSFRNSCSQSLKPGASCSIAVTFNADDSGTRSATLKITDNASGSPQSVPLTGTVGKKGH
jgi:Protein of unknown function (DUF1573)